MYVSMNGLKQLFPTSLSYLGWQWRTSFPPKKGLWNGVQWCSYMFSIEVKWNFSSCHLGVFFLLNLTFVYGRYKNVQMEWANAFIRRLKISLAALVYHLWIQRNDYEYNNKICPVLFHFFFYQLLRLKNISSSIAFYLIFSWSMNSAYSFINPET